jgi:hypothetical protein
MSFLEKTLKATVPSVLVGVGAALLVPVVLPALGTVGRPLAKRVIRGFLAVGDYVKELANEAGQTITELVEEEKADRAAVKEIVAGATAASQQGGESSGEGEHTS